MQKNSQIKKVNIMKLIKELLSTILLAVILAFLLTQVITPSFVREESMEPNFHDGDYVLIYRLAYKEHDLQRGDVAILKEDDRLLIKRVVGLPGEKVEIKKGKVFINDEPLEEGYLPYGTVTETNEEEFSEATLDDDECFVLGDNREISHDSRAIGPINKEDIIGRVVFRAWPWYDIGKI